MYLKGELRSCRYVFLMGKVGNQTWTDYGGIMTEYEETGDVAYERLVAI